MVCEFGKWCSQQAAPSVEWNLFYCISVWLRGAASASSLAIRFQSLLCVKRNSVRTCMMSHIFNLQTAMTSLLQHSPPFTVLMEPSAPTHQPVSRLAQMQVSFRSQEVFCNVLLLCDVYAFYDRIPPCISCVTVYFVK